MSAAWGAGVIDISYLLLWERRSEVLQEDLGFRQKFEEIACGGAAASSIKLRSLKVLNLPVKENCVFCLGENP